MSKKNAGLALFLAVLMIFAVLPLQAFASDEPAEELPEELPLEEPLVLEEQEEHVPEEEPCEENLTGEPEMPAAEAEAEAAEEIAEEEAVEEAAAEEAIPDPAAEEASEPAMFALTLDGASNEQEIYSYLVNTMGLNAAAACGVLANISCESSFNPNAGGDGGTSYGICQWHAGRYTSLKNYCAENGYDYKTLNGQLHYLEYELNLSGYKYILNYMRSVENTAQGAYDAAYYWCYYFEVPANRGSVSVTRGNLAKNTYWPKYVNVSVPNVCVVKFDSNGGAPVGSITVTIGNAVGTLPTPVRDGYLFLGWYSGKDATGYFLTPDTKVVVDTTFYAYWVPTAKYTVTFDANGGENAPAAQTKSIGQTLTLSASVPTKANSRFLGWGTSKSSVKADFAPGGTYADDKSVTLYAIWVPLAYFRVTYNANGGTGAPLSQEKTESVDLTLTTTQPKRTGYVFLGWARTASATKAVYQPGEIYSADADAVMYAVWRKTPDICTAADAAWVLGFVGQSDMATADMNADGSVTALDTAVILRAIVN